MTREIDAQVAQLLGWQRIESPAAGWGQRPSKNGVEVLYALPYYSTTIADAWQIVEWMKEYGWYYGIVSMGDEIEAWFGCQWATESMAMSVSLPQATANTAPLAICKAFLAAHGVEIEDA